MGSSNYRICVCFMRKFRVTELEPLADVKEAFKKYAEGGTHMNAEQLWRFLVEFQGEDEANLSDAEAILHQILQKRHHITKFTRHTLTLDDFYHFLLSVDLNPPIHSKVNSKTTAMEDNRASFRALKMARTEEFSDAL